MRPNCRLILERQLHLNVQELVLPYFAIYHGLFTPVSIHKLHRNNSYVCGNDMAMAAPVGVICLCLQERYAYACAAQKRASQTILAKNIPGRLWLL